MGELLKYATVLILAVMAGFMYIVNEESFFSDHKKFSLFNSYLKRASDPHEKRLRLAESKKVIQNGMKGKQTVTTLKFVDEKDYLNAISKTYKLLLMREANVNSDLDWIEAGLYLVIDYGVREEHEVIYSTGKVRKNDTSWNALNSLYDNPVNRLRIKYRNNIS